MRFLPALAAVLSLVSAAHAAAAQEADGRRNYYALIIGPAMPIGEFARRSAGTPGTGPAEAGYLDTFADLAWRRGKHWGVAASIAYGEFTMTSGDDDWWQVTVISVGPMYARPLTKQLWLELKAKAGAMVTIEVVDSYKNSSGQGLALDLRSGLRYDIFRRWSALAEVGVTASKQAFDIGGPDLNVQALISGIGVAYRW